MSSNRNIPWLDNVNISVEENDNKDTFERKDDESSNQSSFRSRVSYLDNK